MVVAGAVLMVAGEVWGRWFPINKNLWTSSYVLFTGGFALALLALCYWMIEMRGWRRWGAPFVWYGSNAITVFAASTALGVFSVKYHARPGVTYKAWVYGDGVCAAGRPENCVGDVCIRLCINLPGAGLGDVSEEDICEDLAVSCQLSALSESDLDHLLGC